MNQKRLFLKIFLITLMLGAIIGSGFVACSFLGMTTFEAKFDIDDFALPHTTRVIISDENGEEKDWFLMYDMNRENVSFSEIPQSMKDAIVCIEDERFYYHNGVDFLGTAKAVVNFAFGNSDAGGGSTITQQLVKNLTRNDERAWQRKITEILRALNVENNASKDEILETYLNVVYFGNGAYGIKAASKIYFGKEPKDLTVLESASIAGLTQSPATYNPFNEKCKDAFMKRRNSVLKKMYEFDKISKDEYETLIATETEFIKKEGESDTIGSNYDYPYFEQMLIEQLKTDLVDKKGLSYEEATDYLKTGGLKVYATLEPRVQNAIETVYQNYQTGTDAQSAIVIIDPYTGQVRGLTGGLGKVGEEGIKFNRVYTDPRQPGSTIKPIAVYAPAIEMGIINPATPVQDIAYTTVNNHTIKNYDGTYSGEISAKYALQRSKNPTAVQIVEKVGFGNSYEYLKNSFGITTLSENDKGPAPLALGGLTNGVRVDELCAAYSPFVNGGTYYKPILYTHVVDFNGNVILDNREEKGKRAISKSTAFVMNSLLQSVTDPQGTASYAKIPGVPTGAKTGTTDNDSDRWFIGITPHYVGAVWYGYDDRRTVYASGNPSGNIWTSVMRNVYSNFSSSEKAKRFFDGNVPDGVVTREVCAETGFLATELCPTKSFEYFKSDNLPTDECKTHSEEEILLDENGNPIILPEDTENAETDETSQPPAAE